jgi:hypothetical protein
VNAGTLIRQLVEIELKVRVFARTCNAAQTDHRTGFHKSEIFRFVRLEMPVRRGLGRRDAAQALGAIPQAGSLWIRRSNGGDMGMGAGAPDVLTS